VRLTAAELDEKIAAEYPSVGHVRRLTAKSRGVSGRIRVLEVVGDRATVEVTGDLHIRRLLGGLRSALFAIETEGREAAPTAFVLRGKGFGHGVGMCQLGAIGMAKKKRSFREILEHYYRGSALERLY
jgi:SpoIID/LytB domain protein